MTDLQSWREERGEKGFRESLKDAKKVAASEKRKLIEYLGKEMTETLRLAALVEEANNPKN